MMLKFVALVAAEAVVVTDQFVRTDPRPSVVVGRAAR
jgi:hypothetical protein